jgi:competence ComEA-like helix-hairpin-helix protein
MATISLRAYTREIESMIDNGHYEEAVAHCRHILQIFPKHIDTYRLLGRAFLESERFKDADDVLQRLLSSVPDDFISHLGMSVIRENQGNLDAAIWHMERAYDVQPANTSVQSELKRLYKLRDEIEPSKIHLTRGALARMYLKGDLYPQAIAELQSALTEEEDRFDLQTLLARAYLLAGKKVEAVETCSKVINKLPYCLEANRILAEVLPDSERAEEALTYRERVQLLDPYAAHYSSQLTSPDEVSDSAIKIEKLEYSPEEPILPAEEQIEWIDSMGINFEGLSPSENTLPEWLNKPLEETQDEPDLESKDFQDETDIYSAEVESENIKKADQEIQESIPKPDSQDEDLIPDWMRSSGWEPASDTTEISPPSLEEISDELSEAEEIADADMPDWLKDVAPEEAEATEDEDESLPWLGESTVDEPEAVATWLKDTKPAATTEEGSESVQNEGEELPEWLVDMASEIEGEEEIELSDEISSNAEDQLQAHEMIPESEGIDVDIAETSTEIASGTQGNETDESEDDLVVPAWLRAQDESEERKRDLEIGTIPDESVDEEVADVIEMEITEPPDTHTEIEVIGDIGDQPSDEPLEVQGTDEIDVELEPIEETVEEAPILDESDIEEEEPYVIEMPASFEEHDEIDEEDMVTTDKPSPGVTDWLRTLEEVEEATSAEFKSDDEPEIFEEVEEEQIITADKPSGVTGWLKTLEELEEEEVEHAIKPIDSEMEIEPLSQEEELSAPVVSEVVDDQQEMEGFQTDRDRLLEPLEAYEDEEKIEERQEAEKLIEEEPVFVSSEAVEDSFDKEEKEIVEEDKGEKPEKRIPGVTDWLRTLKEIEEKEIVDEESLVSEVEVEKESELDIGDIEKSEVEGEISSVEQDSVEISDGEMPEWLRDLEFDLSADYEAEIMSGDLPEWLQSAAKGEEEAEPEIDWSIFSDEEVGQEGLEGMEREQPVKLVEEDRTDEATPILGDTQPIRRKDKDEELIEHPPEIAQDEVVEAGEEEESVQAEEEEAAMAWLDSLATREGLQEDEHVREDQTVKEETDWIEEATEEVELEIESKAEVEEVSGWIEEEIEPVSIEPEELQAEEIEEAPVSEEIEEPAELEAREELVGEEIEETVILEAEEEQVIEEIEEPAVFEVEEELVEEDIEEPAVLEVEEELVEEDIEEPAVLEVEEELVEKEIEEPAVFEVEEELVEEDIEEPAVFEVEEELVEEDIEKPADFEVEEEPVVEEIEETTVFEVEEELVEGEIEEPAVLEVEQELIRDEIEGPADFEAEEKLIGEEIEEVPVAAETKPEVVVEEKIDLNTASLSQLEHVPGVGFIVAQSIINYRDKIGALENLDELTNIPDIDEDIVEEIRPWLTVKPQEIKPDETRIREPFLMEAWNSIENGEINIAIEKYQHLIKERKFLENVIEDLSNAVQLYPAEIPVFVALGDAYFHNDNLQEALDAYLQAEELLK